MNKYKYAAAICLLSIIGFSSCKKDFLTLYPEGNLNEGIFYKTPTDFQQALNGAYVPLRDIANNAFWMDEMRSDNAHYDYYEKDRGNAQREFIVDFLDDAENAVTAVRYQAAYSGITRLNAVLDHLETNSEISDSLKKVFAAEAKGLRGHYYFDLVRNFGGVPLHIKQTKGKDDSYLPRSSAEDVYKLVISDLTEAINGLPAPGFKAAETGRINKGSVTTELAAVYMQRKEYDKALPLLKEVTKMGYTLMTNFNAVLNPTNKGADKNKELIFDVQYQTGTTGQSSSFIYRFTPITPNTTVILGVNFNNGLGGWNVPTDDLMKLYEAGDTRFDASVGVIEGSLNASQDFVATKVVSAVGYTPTPGAVVKYFCKKYYFPPYPNLNQNTDQNWPLYRYADVLLMLADCLNETGAGGDGLQYLNLVRTRAFGNPSKNITVTDQVQLRKIIAEERRRELAFENKRWQDLIRMDQAIPVMNAYGVVAKTKYTYLLPQSYNVTRERLLYPIPQRDMNLNKLLEQNPGYKK